MPLCLAWRGHPAIINPSDTGHVRRKTDRLDAEKLAQHSLHGLWRESWMAPDEIQELRVLANQRAKLVAERSRLTNRINSDMLRFGHVVGQLGKINGPVVRALIEDFCANGSVAIHRDHFSDTRIPAGVVRVFDQRWKRIDALDQEIKMIEELCIKQADDLTWRIGAGRTASGRQLRSNLESIPGVGTQTVITWLAEVGDITRFGSVNKLLAYAGLDPVGSDLGREGDGDEDAQGECPAARRAAERGASDARPCPVVQVRDVGAGIHGASLPRRQVESDPRAGAAGRQGVVLLPSQE